MIKNENGHILLDDYKGKARYLVIYFSHHKEWVYLATEYRSELYACLCANRSNLALFTYELENGYYKTMVFQDIITNEYKDIRLDEYKGKAKYVVVHFILTDELKDYDDYAPKWVVAEADGLEEAIHHLRRKTRQNENRKACFLIYELKGTDYVWVEYYPIRAFLRP